MMRELSKAEDDKAKEKIEMWTTTPASSSRAKRMADAARKAIAAGLTKQR